MLALTVSKFLSLNALLGLKKIVMGREEVLLLTVQEVMTDYKAMPPHCTNPCLGPETSK
jgi:hypothetical protein